MKEQGFRKSDVTNKKRGVFGKGLRGNNSMCGGGEGKGKNTGTAKVY